MICPVNAVIHALGSVVVTSSLQGHEPPPGDAARRRTSTRHARDHDRCGGRSSRPPTPYSRITTARHPGRAMTPSASATSSGCTRPLEGQHHPPDLRQGKRPGEQLREPRHRARGDDVEVVALTSSARALTDLHPVLERQLGDRLRQEGRPAQQWLDQGHRQVRADQGPHQPGQAGAGTDVGDRAPAGITSRRPPGHDRAVARGAATTAGGPHGARSVHARRHGSPGCRRTSASRERARSARSVPFSRETSVTPA